MNAIEGILSSIKDLAKRVGRLEVQDNPRWVYLAAPLTSTSFDGDSFSTTAKTVMDLSALFTVPAGIKAVLVTVTYRDSASATADCLLILSPNNSAGSGIEFRCWGQVNDFWSNGTGIIPCDANGDIYYQCFASGAGTLDIYIQIWGYLV